MIIFIISAELNLLLGASLLSQKGWTRVEQNFSLFFSSTPAVERSHLYFGSTTPAGCKTTESYRALITRLRSGGQSPIRVSNSSPARIAPTPEGVPVRITSPAAKVSDWLADEMISATG